MKIMFGKMIALGAMLIAVSSSGFAVDDTGYAGNVAKAKTEAELRDLAYRAHFEASSEKKMEKIQVLWDFAWLATHCNLSKLLVAAKVEAQALKQVCPVEYPIAPPK